MFLLMKITKMGTWIGLETLLKIHGIQKHRRFKMAIAKTEMRSVLNMRVWECKKKVDELKEELKEEERYLKIARKQVRDFKAGRI